MNRTQVVRQAVKNISTLIMAGWLFSSLILAGCARPSERHSAVKAYNDYADLAEVKAVEPERVYRLGDTGVCGSVKKDHILVTRVIPGSPAAGKVHKGDLIRGLQNRGLGRDIRRTVAKRIFRLGRDWDWNLTVTVERPGLRDGRGNTIVRHLQLPPKPGILQHFGPTGIYAKMFTDHLVVENVVEDSPADGKLEPGDRIIEVGGKAVQGEIYKLFTDCIDAAETQAGDGRLELTVTRPGGEETADKTFAAELKLPVLGRYNPEAPFTSPKADAIITQAADAIIKNKEHGRLSIGLLGLLATGEDKYIEYVGNVLRESKFAQPDVKLSLSASMTSWPWSYQTITLCEYYLLTGDKDVLPSIRAHALTIAKGQDAAGLWNHRMADPTANFGKLHGRLYGYGAINQTSVALWISLILAEKCGIEHPEIQAAIEKTHALYGNWIDKGALPYGNHGPMTHIFTNNGTSGSVAVAFSLLNDLEGAKFYSRMSAAGHNEILTGHSGPYFNILWSGLGSNIAGPDTAAAFNEKIHWLRTMTRTWDGRFLYMESRGGHFDYSRCSSTGANLLNYCTGRRALFITGKNDHPSIWLKGKAAKHAVDVGDIDYTKQSREALLTLLEHHLPKVRLRAAQMLAAKDADITDEVKHLLTAGSLNQQLGACQAIVQLKITEAVDPLFEIVSNPDEDLWLRQQAAEAMQAIGDPARQYVPELLEIIARDQPGDLFKDFDRTLGSVVNNLAPDPYAMELDKKTFYKAVQVLLNHKHMWGRTSGMKLIETMPLEDFHIVADEMLYVIKDTDRTYTGYHGDGQRQIGLEILNRLNIQEVIPLTVNTIKEKTGRGGARARRRSRLLPEFGANAKPYIPRIKNVLGGRADDIVQTIKNSTVNRDMIPLERAKKMGAEEKDPKQ
ncbi:MAG: DUF6288 domain-containing protein [Lentisphaeria bacterium]